ncbi:MAG: hypothetical protein ABUL60_25005 [Myxococcales bacterium]
MKTLGVFATLALGALGSVGCSPADTEPTREELASCDDGRGTVFHVARDIAGAAQVVADGQGGYLLFRRGGAMSGGVVRVAHDGAVVEVLPNPSVLAPFIQDVEPSVDGRTILGGWLETSYIQSTPTMPTTPGWVGQVNGEWQLEWEAQVGPPGIQHVLVRALSDGGAIVAGTAGEDESLDEATNDARDDAFVARVDPQGQIVWDHRIRFAGSVPADNWRPPQTLMLGTDGRVRFVVQSEQGLLVFSSELDGEDSLEQVLDTRLALGLVGVAPLPDGRLAIASNRNAAVLTMVDSEGQVLWEKTYDGDLQAHVEAITYNATENELVLSGALWSYGESWFRSWLLATDLDGEQTWRMERQPMARAPRQDGDYVTVEPGRGPGLLGLAASPDGSVLVTGNSQMHLCFFTITPGACHE